MIRGGTSVKGVRDTVASWQVQGGDMDKAMEKLNDLNPGEKSPTTGHVLLRANVATLAALG